MKNIWYKLKTAQAVASDHCQKPCHEIRVLVKLVETFTVNGEDSIELHFDPKVQILRKV